MMQKFSIFCIIFLVAILQVSFLPNFLAGNSVPDAVLMIVLIWAIRFDFNRVFWRIIFSGLVMDLMLFKSIGFNVLIFMTIVFLVSSISKRFLVSQFAGRLLVITLMIVSATFLNQFLIMLINKIFMYLNEYQMNFIAWNLDIENKIFWNLIFFSVLYIPLNKIENIVSGTNDNSVIIRR